jgi:hypothetical protein
MFNTVLDFNKNERNFLLHCQSLSFIRQVRLLHRTIVKLIIKNSGVVVNKNVLVSLCLIFAGFLSTSQLMAQSSEEIEISQCSVESPFAPLLINFTYVDWDSNLYLYSASYVHRYTVRKEVLVVRYDRYGNVVLRETVKRQAPMSDTLVSTRRYGSYRHSEDLRLAEVRTSATPEFTTLYNNSVGLRIQCDEQQ